MTKRPLLRRALAALILLTFATGSVIFWNEGGFDTVQFLINLVVAMIGMVWLHLRWRARERRVITPTKARDIFS